MPRSGSEGDAATPVPAATMVLLRDGPRGLEVFMVVRHHQIDFASGALVFPGGKVDPQDEDPGLRDLARGAGDLDATALALCAGAIREAFEEAGVLLAYDAGRGNGREIVDATRLAELESYRHSLHRGEVGLRAFLEREQLLLACDRLTRFAHWITPEMMPKRFDTHFFVAAAPEDHVLLHDGTESVDSIWITPEDALAGARSGRYTVIFPTLRNIEKLARYAGVDAAIAGAERADVVTVLPWVETRDDGRYLCIPPEAGYRVNEERMPEGNRPDRPRG